MLGFATSGFGHTFAIEKPGIPPWLTYFANHIRSFGALPWHKRPLNRRSRRPAAVAGRSSWSALLFATSVASGATNPPALLAEVGSRVSASYAPSNSAA